MTDYDVIVVGGGNAAICAAMAARHIRPRVLVLERAPIEMRGGNTRHTRNVRCAHDAADQYFSGPYTQEEFLEDLIGVTGGPANVDLAKLLIRESNKLPQWMVGHGAAWQMPLAGTLSLGRTNRWFLGGGKALLNAYYRTAHRMGITVHYNSLVEDFVLENDRFEAVVVKNGNARTSIHGRTVVAASGGYEANIEWLKQHWGSAADNFLIRGTPYNDGSILAALLKHGARTIGDPKGFHAVAIDARAPRFDGGIVTRLDAIPFGVVVNRDGRRFYDEGEAIWPKRYAIWGGLVASQPDQLAYVVVDSKVFGRFLPPVFKPYHANSLGELAAALQLPAKSFCETIIAYNCATVGNHDAKMESPDGNSTRGISPPKSNWALPIDTPPFYALPLRPGITFTYMGVAVDEIGRVLNKSGEPFKNVFAAGEIMSGNILTKGYLAGVGMTIGSVFGELAGRMAAKNA